MPRRIGLVVVLLALGVVVGVMLRPNHAADPPKEEKKEPPIPIMDVWTRGILGQLNHPLGTIVRVEGEVANDDYRGLRADLGRTLLRVKSVNGTELKKEVVFQFDGAEADKPKVGAKFKYIGYETGEFDGEVDDNDLYKRTLILGGTRRYGFNDRFRILKDELKPEKK